MTSQQTKKTDAVSLNAALADLEILLREGKPAADALGVAAEDNDVHPVLLNRCFVARHGTAPGAWLPTITERTFQLRRARASAVRRAAWAREIDDLTGMARVSHADFSIPAGTILRVAASELALCYLLPRTPGGSGASIAAVPVGEVIWEKLTRAEVERPSVAASSLALGSLEIRGLEELSLPDLMAKLNAMVLIAGDAPIDEQS